MESSASNNTTSSDSIDYMTAFRSCQPTAATWYRSVVLVGWFELETSIAMCFQVVACHLLHCMRCKVCGLRRSPHHHYSLIAFNLLGRLFSYPVVVNSV